MWWRWEVGVMHGTAACCWSSTTTKINPFGIGCSVGVLAPLMQAPHSPGWRGELQGLGLVCSF